MNNPHQNQNYSEADKEKCPFYKSKQNLTKESPFKEKVAMSTPNKSLHQSPPKSNKCPYKTKKADDDTSDEEMGGGGGCPMMGTSKKKRNPGLWVPPTSQNIPYVSPFYEFLKQNSFFS